MMIISLRLKPGENLKIFCFKDGQIVGDYVMCHEKCKVKMRQFKMDFREHLHGLNYYVELRQCSHHIVWVFVPFHKNIWYDVNTIFSLYYV